MSLSPEADAKYNTEELFTDYIRGLVDNWLRKDVRLNGGQPYVTKNPGSRAGGSDDVVKTLKALLTTVTDIEQKAAVQSEIDARVAQLKAAKTKPINIDASKIPAHLQHLLSK